MKAEFRWNEWNLEHATRHGVSVREIERVVRNATRPFPKKIGDDKWLVQGRGQGDRLVQVAYVVDPARTLYVIHAMPLSVRRKRRGR